MASTETTNDTPVRINDLDWRILKVMADGRRYTPAHLYRDFDEFDEWGNDWVRQRVNNIYEAGLIDRVGTSSMYEINEWGETALENQKEWSELEPREFHKRVRGHGEP